MRGNIKKYIITFFILIVTFIMGAEQKIPNVMILENPKKEVTTVEGLKNKEAAEMNIKVKKRDMEEIVGIEGEDGIMFILPNTGFSPTDEIKVVKSLANLPSEPSKLKRSKRSAPSVETPSTVTDVGENKVIKIPKEEVANTNYILKMDKEKKVNKIYRARVRIKRELVAAGTVEINRVGALYMRLSSNYGDNALQNGKLSVIRRVWSDSPTLAAVGFGFVNREFIAKKIGNDSDQIKVRTSRWYTVTGTYPAASFITAGDTNFAPGGGGPARRSDGGYLFTKALFLYMGHELGGSSDVDVELTFNIDASSQGSYLKNGGIFRIDNFPRMGLKQNVWNSEWGAPFLLTAPEELFLLATRYPKNARIAIDSIISLDSDNKISIKGALGDELGYVNDGISVFDVTDMDSSGITLDRSGLKFPPDLKPGIYRLKVVWKAGLGGYSDNVINGDGDLVTIEFRRPEVNVGEVVFKVDNRLPKGKIIFADGSIKGTRSGAVEGQYPELVKIEGRYSGLTSVNIRKIIEVEGRPYFESTANNISRFDVRRGVVTDGSYLPINFNLSNINNEITIESTNSNPLKPGMENNRFTMLGDDKKLYKGNVKEVYMGEDGEDITRGIATLDLSGISMSDSTKWTRWSRPGVTGNAASTGGASTVMKFSRGKLFNWKSAVQDSGKNIITRITVAGDGEYEEVTGRNLQTTKFDKNIIGVDDSGLFVIKSKDFQRPIDYSIVFYYKDIPLGSLTLTVINSKPIDIGEVVFNIDNRFPKGSLIYANGDVKSTASGAIRSNYSELVEVRGSFKNLADSAALPVSVEGRPYANNVGGFLRRYDATKGSEIDSSYVPFGSFPMSNLMSKIVVSNNNSNPLSEKMSNNKFTIDSNTGRYYTGNIKEKYIGESAITGVATLDMSEVASGGWTRWDIPKLGGSVSSTSGRSTIMKFSTGKLFNWKSALETGNKQIVTRLEVINRGRSETATPTGSINQKKEVKSFTNNVIGIERDGGIFVTKKNESQIPEIYEIKAYYKDVLLGSLNLTVTNSKLIDIGEVRFNIDNRIPKGRLLFPTGDVKLTRDGAIVNNYSELIDIVGNFKNLVSEEINEALSVEGRPHKKTGNFILNNIARFDVTSGTDVDSSYIPINFNLLNIRDKILVDNTNSTPMSGEMKNNKFKITSTTGKIFGGNIIEEYNTSVKDIGGNLTLDMTNATLDKVYTFDKTLLPGRHPSSDALVSAELAGGMPKTQGIRKANIITNLIISKDGGASTNIVGSKYTDPDGNYSVSFNVSGDLEVVKLKNNAKGIEDTLGIRYFYKDIELGTFTLKITSKKSSFEIVGTNVIDFGAIIQGKKTTVDGNIKIRNLDSKKIVNVSLNEKKPIKVFKKTDKGIELPVVSDVYLWKKGTEVPVKVNLTAKPTEDQATGEYEGELNLYIDIE